MYGTYQKRTNKKDIFICMFADKLNVLIFLRTENFVT